jgi:hypothetical protein
METNNNDKIFELWDKIKEKGKQLVPVRAGEHSVVITPIRVIEENLYQEFDSLIKYFIKIETETKKNKKEGFSLKSFLVSVKSELKFIEDRIPFFLYKAKKRIKLIIKNIEDELKKYDITDAIERN